MSTKTSFELLALSRLIKNKDQELFLETHVDLFTGQYKQIYKFLQKSFSDNHKLPGMDMVQATINSKAPAELRPALNGILSAIEGLDDEVIDAQSISKGLRDKHLLSTLDSKVTDLNQKALHKDVEGVRQVLSEIVESINLDSVKPTDFMEAMERPDQSKLLPSGIDELDEYIGGVAGLTIVSGSSGGGKSIALLQMATGQFQQGMNILYISLELSAQTLGNRLKSSLSGIDFSKLNKGLVTPEETEHIKSCMDTFKARDNVFRVVTDPLDADELLNLIKVEKSLYNIDVVYIDYLNLILPSKTSAAGWASLADTAKALHRLSHQLGVVTISASQVNVTKKPSGTKPPELETRGSKELEFSATLWMHLYTPEDGEEGSSDSVVIFVMKNRNASRTAIMMQKQFNIMRLEFVCEV